MNLSRKKQNKSVTWIILAVSFTMLIVRCFFSFCQTDESFYVALIHRFWMGELLAVEEWHPVQFYAPALVPLYALFRLFSPQGNGVILYFRIIYTLLSLAVALLSFRVLTSKGWKFALPAALMILFYSRANIGGMSYYNLCFLMVVLDCMLFINRGSAFCGGIAAALAVLCNPYLGIAVIALIIYGVIRYRLRQKDILLFVAGVGAAAVLYVLLFFRNIPEQLQGLRYVLSEPSHIGGVWNSILNGIKGTVINSSVVLSFAAAALSVFALLNETGRWERLAFTVFYVLAAAAVLYRVVRCYNGVAGSVSAPVTVAAFPALLVLLKRKQAEKTETVLYFAGIATAISFMFASNTGGDAMTVGFCISAMASFGIILRLFLSTGVSSDWERTVRRTALSIICGGLLVSFVLQRLIGVYQDANLWELDTRLETGPAQGLYTTAEHAEQYHSICRTIGEAQEMMSEKDVRVLHSKLLPWTYCCTDWEYGTASAFNARNAWLQSYYQIHPEKIPDLVFIYEPEAGKFDHSVFNNHGTSREPNLNRDGSVLDSIPQREYVLIMETEYVKVYSS